MNPHNILFSIPTLCDALPPLNAAMPGNLPDRTVRMAEDDWRQVEFVANGDQVAVDRELLELRRFKVEKRSGAGWTDVYLRSSRGDSVRPLGIRLPDLLRTARATSSSDLYLETGGAVAKVRGGFTFPVHDVTLYGHAEADGRVASLGILVPARGALKGETRTALLALCRTLGLFIVDWYRAEVIAN
jgi:hypothetical protein